MSEANEVDAVVSNRRWENGEKLSVWIAVDNDYKSNDMNGRDNIVCPICHAPKLAYRRTSIFDMTAWCYACETGIKQGNGAC